MRKLVLRNHFSPDLIWRMARWHAAYYLFGRGTPLNAGVYLTDACDCRCVMCDIWKCKKPSVYPREAQEHALDALSRAGCYYYSISGGEPTLVKDLCDRVAYAAARIPYVHLVTNGLSLNKELARELAGAGLKEISISLDGSETYHNTMRGIDDAYERAWRALELCSTHAPGVQIVVNSVLSPYNLHGLRELGRELRSFPRVCQKYLPLTVHQLFLNRERKSLQLPGEKASAADMEAFLNAAARDPRVVNSPVFLRKAKRFFRGEENIIPEQSHCLYPYHGMEFDSRGFAYPCRTGMGCKNGIPPEADLEESLRSAAYRSRQRELRSCTKCHGSMMLCYYEPRLNFPLPNLLRGMLSR